MPKTTSTKQRDTSPAKVDLRAVFPHVYKAKEGRPETVVVPKINFLMVDGHGDPNTSAAYMDAIKALYTTAYGAKFALKGSGSDFAVMPLETLWWSENEPFDLADKEAWSWTATLAVPETVTPGLVAEIVDRAYAKEPLETLHAIRLESYREGPAAQVLHIGPYAAEGPTVVALHEFIAANGMHPRGKHHEIYFSDPRRTPPGKLRTLIRQPCEANGGVGFSS